MASVSLQCTTCGRRKNMFPPVARCDICGGILDYTYNYEELPSPYDKGKGLWRYRRIFPPVSDKCIVSMGEGGTPLREARELAHRIGGRHIYLKDESVNPTSSYRDRAASLIVSNALDLGAKTIVCASHGNFGAAAAAYCAKVKMGCTIVTPKEVNVGKLAQMHIYGGKILRNGDTIDEAIVEAEKMGAKSYQATPELNPLSVEAQKTISHEIFEKVKGVDWVIVPTGTGNTAYSIWKGVKECLALSLIEDPPGMVLAQAEGCATLISEEGKIEVRKVKNPKTIALGLLVASPAYGGLAVQAVRESGGKVVTVTDEEIITAERILAKAEGIFSEPASAASVACFKKLLDYGEINPSETVVCLITASGLKDPYVIDALANGAKRGVRSRGGFKTKLEILRFLEVEESYGYEIWKALGKRLSIQAVYQHLEDLLARGLIEEITGKRRKYFKLTRKGERILRALEELSLLL